MNFQEELCAWYKIHHRELPFRQTRDPYAIWVSEIMAQQTRIDSMLPYYRRWMERWPTVEALAKAPIEDVLHGWQGLGYYNRARKLHEGAKVVAGRYGGISRPMSNSSRTIPGTGFYTAGAIGSIAYGLRAPAVDGNVLRVTTRVLRYGEDITKKTTVDFVWRQVYDWMEGSDPAVFTPGDDGDRRAGLHAEKSSVPALSVSADVRRGAGWQLASIPSQEKGETAAGTAAVYVLDRERSTSDSAERRLVGRADGRTVPSAAKRGAAGTHGSARL